MRLLTLLIVQKMLLKTFKILKIYDIIQLNTSKLFIAFFSLFPSPSGFWTDCQKLFQHRSLFVTKESQSCSRLKRQATVDKQNSLKKNNRKGAQKKKLFDTQYESNIHILAEELGQARLSRYILTIILLLFLLKKFVSDLNWNTAFYHRKLSKNKYNANSAYVVPVQYPKKEIKIKQEIKISRGK